MAGRDETLYVFALADPGRPRTIRLLGHQLHRLSLGAVDAIVERRRGRVKPTTKALQQQHAIVGLLVSRTRALLPARFGSTIEREALRAIAASRTPEILDALARVRGRRQMTIRVFGSGDRTVPTDDRTTSGTAFLKSRHARAHHVPPEVDAIRTALGSLTQGERVERGQGVLRVTVYHLVSTQDIESYARVAGALVISPHQLTVSGPWPAFAFAPELF